MSLFWSMLAEIKAATKSDWLPQKTRPTYRNSVDYLATCQRHDRFMHHHQTGQISHTDVFRKRSKEHFYRLGYTVDWLLLCTVGKCSETSIIISHRIDSWDNENENEKKREIDNFVKYVAIKIKSIQVVLCVLLYIYSN